MSAKVAVIIGDYSNGWSDAQIVQLVGNFTEKELRGDKQSFVLEIMSKACQQVVRSIESDERICPKPKDDPCCAKFEEWAGSKPHSGEKNCPYCGTAITKERGERFFNQFV